jgi:hypothetical protein
VRFGLRTVGSEAWQAWRWFDWELLRAAWRLLSAPGQIAREYVLGARKRHVHPLKLLLLGVGVLMLVLARSNFLDSQYSDVNRAHELLRAWSNWSFSFGIVALWAASRLAFRRRGGYNAVEHGVLAVYGQFLVLCASVAYRLPTLFWREPDFLAAHKSLAPLITNSVGVAVLVLAFMQFFRLDLRRDGLRLCAAAALFLGFKWLLVRAYAWLLAQWIWSA